LFNFFFFRAARPVQLSRGRTEYRGRAQPAVGRFHGDDKAAGENPLGCAVASTGIMPAAHLSLSGNGKGKEDATSPDNRESRIPGPSAYGGHMGEFDRKGK
jgi:hypothetical protein